MNDKNLIDELVANHSKVKPTASIKARFMKWFLICLLCLSSGISMLGLREDWIKLFASPLLLLQNVFILVGIIIAGLLAINLSIPSTSSKRVGRKFLYIIGTVWTIILLLIGIINHSSLDELTTLSFGCIRDIVVIGIVPGIALFIFIRQGVVLERKLVGVIGMIASFGIGVFGVQYTCHNDSALHILVWHFLPLIILGGIGVIIGRKFLDKL